MVFHWNFAFLAFALEHTLNDMGVWWELDVRASRCFAGGGTKWQGLLAPIVPMAVAGYLSTAMQGRFHPYYFETCYPFFAMFWADVLTSTYKAFEVSVPGALTRRWACVGARFGWCLRVSSSRSCRRKVCGLFRRIRCWPIGGATPNRLTKCTGGSFRSTCSVTSFA